jgi:hypothetical protein
MIFSMSKISLALLLILSACASAPDTKETIPAWVNHPEQNYPSTRYLVAVGTGSSREAAIQDAKKQMAESFVVKVQSLTKVNAQSTLSQDTTGSVSSDANQNVSKDVSFETSTRLRSSEVKEVATVGDETYALLALDKLAARTGLLGDAAPIKNELNSLLESVEENFNQVQLSKAKQKYAQLQELFGEASALGMSTLIDMNDYQARMLRLENAARNKNRGLAFVVTVVKGENFFERDLEACINDNGGTLYSAEKAPASVNKIQITVTERPQHMKMEGWEKIRFDLSATIIQADGKKFQAQTTQTESGRSRSAILETVSDKLSHDLCEQVFNRVSELKTVGKE